MELNQDYVEQNTIFMFMQQVGYKYSYIQISKVWAKHFLTPPYEDIGIKPTVCPQTNVKGVTMIKLENIIGSFTNNVW